MPYMICDVLVVFSRKTYPFVRSFTFSAFSRVVFVVTCVLSIFFHSDLAQHVFTIRTIYVSVLCVSSLITVTLPYSEPNVTHLVVLGFNSQLAYRVACNKVFFQTLCVNCSEEI